jgi:putative endonuclease
MSPAKRAKAATPKPNGRRRACDREHDMNYVYILRSRDDSERHYVGVTGDLRERLKKHNAGDVPHTAKYAPWSIKTYLAFSDEKRAYAFEKYLKSASGRAFAKKRL